MRHIIRGKRQLKKFEAYLKTEEKAPETRKKYMRDVRGFLSYSKGRISKETVVAYKEQLVKKKYSPRSVNAMLAGVRSFLRFCGKGDIKIKNLKVQRSAYVSESRVLQRSDYEKLLKTAEKRGDIRMKLLLECICATGIRVSEIRYFTVEAVRRGEISINLKGKIRSILMTGKLRKKLLAYSKELGIRQGCIFLNHRGRPLHRSHIWQMMKILAKAAKVDERKVFPHNLRRLFARIFYNAGKDIAKLADILGHSSIDTTRIYVATLKAEHVKMMERLRIVT